MSAPSTTAQALADQTLARLGDDELRRGFLSDPGGMLDYLGMAVDMDDETASEVIGLVTATLRPDPSGDTVTEPVDEATAYVALEQTLPRTVRALAVLTTRDPLAMFDEAVRAAAGERNYDGMVCALATILEQLSPELLDEHIDPLRAEIEAATVPTEEEEAMDEQTARRIVADDQRESYPDMTDEQAVAHAVYTINPDEVDDDGTDLAEAYKLVLSGDVMDPETAREIAVGERA